MASPRIIKAGQNLAFLLYNAIIIIKLKKGSDIMKVVETLPEAMITITRKPIYS